MHAFDVLGDPVRRRILELLVDGEQTSGVITETIRDEFGISQPAVSQHLKVLREGGFVHVRPEGTRRHYRLDAAPLREVDAWVSYFRRFWEQHLDARSALRWRAVVDGRDVRCPERSRDSTVDR
jgi:DNA-binding transcriptional ArsR family regulator